MKLHFAETQVYSSVSPLPWVIVLLSVPFAALPEICSACLRQSKFYFLRSTEPSAQTGCYTVLHKNRPFPEVPYDFPAQ